MTSPRMPPQGLTANQLVAGGFRIGLDGGARLGFFVNGTEVGEMTNDASNFSLNSLIGNLRLNPDTGGSGHYVELDSPTKMDFYDFFYKGSPTTGLGLAPIYAMGNRVSLAATASPGTSVLAYTPVAGGYILMLTVKNIDTVAVTANAQIVYTDPDAGAQTVLIINALSLAANGVASVAFRLDSTTATITVSGWGSVANMLVVSADLLETQ